MSDEPLPVTLDNIRKWDADMRGSDDRARHIALYYFATNLREVVGVLFAELAEAQTIAIDALKPFADCIEQIVDDEDDEEWAKFRLLIKDYRRAAQAIRALKSPKPPIL